jgi:biopolymer transport protein ExbB
MYQILDWYEAIRDFLDLGGPVLVVIGWLTAVMWVLVFERVLYFRTGHRRLVREVKEIWARRSERRSWHARKIRLALISRVSVHANAYVVLIKTLVALCPLLGLLGTVTGMIEVFEVMAFTGSGNPRLMAAGVSKATIPTMGGMVAALSGVFASTLIARYVHRQVEHLRSELTTRG